jgi:hypothetical protein
MAGREAGHFYSADESFGHPNSSRQAAGKSAAFEQAALNKARASQTKR